jgi:putative ABC transport system permease protein
MLSPLTDLRHSVRRLARRPGFAGVVVGTLALGIGGATAIFSIADAVLLRPLPFADPARLVVVAQHDLRNQSALAISYPVYQHWRDHNRVFTDLAGMAEGNGGWTLTGRGEPVELVGRLVTANFASVTGVKPLLGRFLAPEDDRIGAAPSVVISYELWRERFSQDPAILGQALVLDGKAHAVVGVMPRGFAYPPAAQLWMPLVPGVGATTVEHGGIQWMTALGRVKPGVSLASARTDLTGLLGGYLHEVMERLRLHDVLDPRAFTGTIEPLAEAMFGRTRPVILALLGGVLVVLLIAAANVAGLLLMQTAERRSEMVVRMSLGASRGRLARAVFAESLLLSALGGSAGLFIAWLAVPLLVRLSPEDVPRLQDAAIDARVFVFALLVLLATACLSALAAMLLVLRTPLETTLREGTWRVGGRSRLRSALVVSQVAAALVLLVGAGLLGRSFVELRRAPLGFEPERVLAGGLWAPEARYPDRQSWRAFYQDVLRRVQAIPGVDSAATASVRPLSGPGGWDFPFTAEGQTEAEAGGNPMANLESVSADYFRTMGIVVKKGRVFTDGDVEGQPGVVVVSEALAGYAWPGQDPIGKRLKIPQLDTPYHQAWMEVVGVVGNVRYRELQATRLDLYLSHLQSDHRSGSLMVRTHAEPTLVAAAVRDILWSLDKDKAPPTVSVMTGVVSEALAGPRFTTAIFGAFALVALVLSALGLYGLLAYSTARRTREIGVRVALGARPRDVGRLVLREGLRLTVTGIGCGLAVAWATTRLFQNLLYGVKATDGVSIAAAVGLLLAVGLLACGLPVRRALGVDPAEALREE